MNDLDRIREIEKRTGLPLKPLPLAEIDPVPEPGEEPPIVQGYYLDETGQVHGLTPAKPEPDPCVRPAARV